MRADAAAAEAARPMQPLPGELRGRSEAGPLVYMGFYRPSALSSLSQAVALDMIRHVHLRDARPCCMFNVTITQ